MRTAGARQQQQRHRGSPGNRPEHAGPPPCSGTESAPLINPAGSGSAAGRPECRPRVPKSALHRSLHGQSPFPFAWPSPRPEQRRQRRRPGHNMQEQSVFPNLDCATRPQRLAWPGSSGPFPRPFVCLAASSPSSLCTGEKHCLPVSCAFCASLWPVSRGPGALGSVQFLSAVFASLRETLPPRGPEPDAVRATSAGVRAASLRRARFSGAREYLFPVLLSTLSAEGVVDCRCRNRLRVCPATT